MEIDFKPLPLLKSGWAQTIAGHYWPHKPDRAPTAQHFVNLPDGDRLVVIENRPDGWKNGDRIALLVHGLSGSYQSTYMVRLCRELMDKGLLVIRINLRGCGPGRGHASNLYHSGRSEDTRAVLEWLAARYDSPVTQIGFSLGANITLKMAGEDGTQPSGRLDSVVAISPPIDLAACARHMRTPKNFIFDQFFVLELRRDLGPGPRPKLPRFMTLEMWDDLYTAPKGGFKDAKDYYARCSSEQFIPRITVPTLILSAKDDPIIEPSAFQRLPKMPNVTVCLTDHGGHVGFLGRSKATPQAGVQWMDSLVTTWVTARS